VTSQTTLKNKDFLWLIYQNRIQTADNLWKNIGRGVSSVNCVMQRKQLTIFLPMPVIDFYVECNQRWVELEKGPQRFERLYREFPIREGS
jgi:hypothetical protein